jgi:hypothetical protein
LRNSFHDTNGRLSATDLGPFSNATFNQALIRCKEKRSTARYSVRHDDVLQRLVISMLNPG